MKPRVAWLSPLAPGESESLRPHLEEQFEVRYFGESPAGFLELASKRKFNSRPGKVNLQMIRQLNQLEVPFYQLGGAGENIHTLFLARRKPGLVLLRGRDFSRMIESVYRGPTADRQIYLRLMQAYYGALGREAAEADWDGRIPRDFMREHFPFTGFATENALGVIVENEDWFLALRETTAAPVFYLPGSKDNPAKYAAGLLEIVESVPALRLRRVKVELAARIGRTIPSAVNLGGQDRYARVICELLG